MIGESKIFNPQAKIYANADRVLDFLDKKNPAPILVEFDPSNTCNHGCYFCISFDIPGIYLYQCTPHKSMGMIGLVVVGHDTSNKDTVAKAKVIGKSKKKLKALLGNL